MSINELWHIKQSAINLDVKAIDKTSTCNFVINNYTFNENMRQTLKIRYFPLTQDTYQYTLQSGYVGQSVAPLTQEPKVPGSNPGPATYFHFSFRWIKKGSCQLLTKVCAQSTG